MDAKSEKKEWYDLGLVDSDALQSRVFDVGFDEIWIFGDRGHSKAVSNICPHKMGPMSEGALTNDSIECPWHGFRFDINSGRCVGGGTCAARLRIYELKNEAGHLFIKEKE